MPLAGDLRQETTHSPCRPWLLFDLMLQFGEFMHVVTLIRAELDRISTSTHADSDRLSPYDARHLFSVTGEWHKKLSQAGRYFNGTLHANDGLLSNEMTYGELRSRLHGLIYTLEAESRFIYVEIISQEKTEYLYNRGFGDVIAAAFPSAHPEIVEADRCYAFGLSTATVFHLMRAVEHALRATAVSVGITSPKLPLEYQQWEALISQIEARINGANIDSWPQPSRANARAFFKATMSDLYAFKDSVRNVLMHTRAGGTFDEPGALSIRNRVFEFFSRLVGRVDESAQRPLLDQSLF